LSAERPSRIPVGEPGGSLSTIAAIFGSPEASVLLAGAVGGAVIALAAALPAIVRLRREAREQVARNQALRHQLDSRDHAASRSVDTLDIPASPLPRERDSAEVAFQDMIERLPMGVAIHFQGIIRYANAAMLGTLGFPTMEHVVGKPILDFVDPQDRPVVADRMRALAEGKPLQAARVGLFHADGRVVPCETTPVRMIDFRGEPCNLVLVQDITERLEMEVKLQLADRMVSLGTMAAGVAHEVNNPLAYVIGNLELVREALRELPSDGHDLGNIDRMLAEALEGSERVRRIVLDLKTFSRAAEEPGAPVDVHAVLETAIRIAGNEIRHRARLVRKFGQVPRIEANESRLAQVFLNLLVNAAQAIPEGEAENNTIELATRVDPLGRVVVEVTDSGVGIEPEVQRRMFDPFFTTKPVGIGTGLGLSIVHGIVASMGGELTFESQPGRGSTFRVHLPALAAGRRTLSIPPDDAPSVPAPLTGGARILCVDDEPAILEMLEAALAGHRVRSVSNGYDAVVACLSEDWDLVLCDLMMADLSGIDVWERVTARRPELGERFVFLTGGAFTPRAREFLGRVPNARLEKPFRIDAIKRLVAQRLPPRPEPPARQAELG
jgi:two-component system cell cycle sensor histidine kinase/response regulator CckA